MKKIIQLIQKKNPLIIVNGKKVENFSNYYKKLDYTNNCLHTSRYNEETNVLTLGFISEYAMKKICNIV